MTSDQSLLATSSVGENYFDIQEGKTAQATPQKAEAALTWRGDPAETHSDFTIVVVTNELHTTTFHAHKSVLCFGRRQSRYFAKIALNESGPGSSSKKAAPHWNRPPIITKVELDEQDASNFEVLLDYIYAPVAQMLLSEDTVLTAASTLSSPSLFTVPSYDTDSSQILGEDLITTENSVSLRYLARKFEVDAFTLAVNKFIQRSLSFSTGPWYLSQACQYGDDRLQESAQKLCAENFDQLDIESLTVLPLHLFRVVVKSLESFDEENVQLSHFVSDTVCKYFEANEKSISSEALLDFTDPLLMPYMTAEAAIGFTAFVKVIPTDDAAKHWEGLVGLCRRCAKCVVDEYGWSEFSVAAAVDEYLGKRSAQRRVSRVDSLLFATSFAAALERAQNDYEIMITEQENLAHTVRLLYATVQLMDDMNQKKDKQMTMQQSALVEAQIRISALEQQVRDMNEKSRPVGPPTPRDSSSRVKGMNARTPERELSVDEIVKDLVSPSEVEGAVMAYRKNQRRKEYPSVEEMRSRSLV